jgi:hypothetical protein
MKNSSHNFLCTQFLPPTGTKIFHLDETQKHNPSPETRSAIILIHTIGPAKNGIDGPKQAPQHHHQNRVCRENCSDYNPQELNSVHSTTCNQTINTVTTSQQLVRQATTMLQQKEEATK